MLDYPFRKPLDYINSVGISPSIPANQPYAQYSPIGKPWGAWGYNLCGLLCLEVIHNQVNDTTATPNLESFFDAVARSKTSKTAAQLIEAWFIVEERHGKTESAVWNYHFRSVYHYPGKAIPKKLIEVKTAAWYKDDRDRSTYAENVAEWLYRKAHPVLTVMINHDGLIIPEKGVTHWVVATAVAPKAIQVYNPFCNRIEAYPSWLIDQSAQLTGGFMFAIHSDSKKNE